MAEIVLLNDVNGQLGFSRYAGPYCIASRLRSEGYNVQVIEFFGDFEEPELKQLVDAQVDSSTLFVGFAATLWSKHLSAADSLKIWRDSPSAGINALFGSYTDLFPHTDDKMTMFIDYIKTKNKKTKIVVGGYKALGKKFNSVDFWVLGQGEESAVAIANYLKFDNDLKFIDTENGKILTDKIYPFNHFSSSKIIWTAEDHIFHGEHLPIETARGCIFKCSFCAFNLNGKKFGDYNKAAQTLKDELLYNYYNFGTTEYMICDDTINDSMEKVIQLHSVFTSLPFRVTLSGYVRLDVIAANKEMATLLQEMGMVVINCGIETFHREAGRHLGKGADPELLKDTLYSLKDSWKDDVYISGNFIVGLPLEPIESIRKTFDWLYRDDCPLSAVGVNRLIPRNYYPSISPSNISDEDMIKYGFTKMPEGWQYMNTNKIETDPTKYKIIMNPTDKYDWTSPLINKKQVVELINEFHSDPRCKQKFAFTAYHGYNRMRNLGYSHQEVGSMYMTDPNIVVDGINKRAALKKEYLAKVL